MSSVAGQSVAIGNLGKVGGTQITNNEKLQMFVERYLELSSELKYRKGESGAYMQLGQIHSQKGDYDSSTKHFYRAMKIAEETGDAESKDQAKVNFGIANANLKWGQHMSNILKTTAEYAGKGGEEEDEKHDEEDDEENVPPPNEKLPPIHK